MSQAAAVQDQFLPPEKRTLVAALASGLDRGQLTWVSGYLAGMAAAATVGTDAAAPAAAAVPVTAQLTILSASHTGNGRRLCERLLASAQREGMPARLVKAGDYAARDIGREKYLYVVISTHGDGDPPEEARALFEFLGSKRAPQLQELQFAVLALGDSSYARFCEAGRLLDERLARLGARRLLPRVDCDVDFERLASPWMDDAIARVGDGLRREAPGITAAASAPAAAAPAAVPYTRANPAVTEVIVNQRITGRRALREVRHLELAFAGLGGLYRPGDALGIVHRNPERAIERVLGATGLTGDESVTADGATRSLAEWLRDEREITRISRPLLTGVAERSGAQLGDLLEPRSPGRLAALIANWQVADVLEHYPARWDAQALVAVLRRVTGRVYSIASSPAMVGDEAHLTVALVGSDTDNAVAPGAASGFLGAQLADARVGIWIERNERFRLPADTKRDIVMVGPGTGVAPFRGFLQEREAVGATGRNWLVFGGRSLREDFLYQVEWLGAMRRKVLHRLDVAFSRDQAHRIYVQQRLREAGRELFAWLADGAYLYVCGDARRMAPDVDAALIDIAHEQGRMGRDDAEAWVANLTAEGRYLRDVY